MKKIILVAALFLIFISVRPLDAQWVKIYGDSDRDVAYFIQQTSDGGYVVAGGEDSDGYLRVLKLDSNGSIEWKAAYRGSYYKIPLSFQQTSDGGYIFACHAGRYDVDDNYTYKDEIWVIKLNSSGGYDSTSSFGRFINNGEYARAFQPTDDGGYVLAGETRIYGAGGNDIWVSKLNSAGDVEWQMAYGGIENDRVSSLQQTNDGGYILSCDTQSFGSSEDIWILKLDSMGNIEWQRNYGGIYEERASSVHQTNDGGYIFAGNTQSFGAGGGDIWIIKLSALGNIEWQQACGGTGEDRACSIQQTADGGYVVGGTTSSFGEGGDDFWILKLSQAGDIELQKTFGTNSGEIARTLRQTSDGGYIAAGSISSYGSGSSDFLVIKLFSDGNIDSPCKFLQDSSAQVTITSISLTDTGVIPLYCNVIRELVDTSLGTYDTVAVEYELCSNNPLFAVHATTGGTTDPPPGTSVRVLGEEVALTAIPESGQFIGWSGDVTQASEEITVIMNEDKAVTANFSPLEYMLTIQCEEGGTTSPEPGSYTYDYGSDVIVTAVPNSGYEFSEWSGDIAGTSNPVHVRINSDKSITANFTQPSEEQDLDDSLNKIFRLNCAIATAAHDSPFHPHVQVLRDFRDEYLMRSKHGRGFVELYYRYSPRIAEIISQHKPLKVAVRLHLLPLIAFSYSMVRLGPLMTAFLVIFIFGFPIPFGVILQKRTIKKFRRLHG